MKMYLKSVKREQTSRTQDEAGFVHSAIELRDLIVTNTGELPGGKICNRSYKSVCSKISHDPRGE